MSILLGRGAWEYRLLPVTSTATFVKGAIVKLKGDRTVTEMTSNVTDTSLLGIAQHDSVNSLPSGKVLVAIPRQGCTAFAPLASGWAASSLSLGQAVAFVKSGNTYSAITTSPVTFHAEIVGPINSTTSRVEIAFLLNALQFYSTATNAI